jgi:hypothetical protein
MFCPDVSWKTDKIMTGTEGRSCRGMKNKSGTEERILELVEGQTGH